MPVNGYSVGRDVSLDLITASGALKLNQITGFGSQMVMAEVKVKGIDGITRHVRMPDGWSGKFSLERQDSTLDDYFAQIEANYYAGLTEQPVTLTETIQEVNGSITQYRYMNVLLKYDDAGEWRGDGTVKQSLGFIAARRVKIA